MNRIFGTVLMSAIVFGQTKPTFEVASVRQTPQNRIGYTSISPSGAAQFTASNATLELLIGFAYGIDSNRIVAKQTWLGSEHYDISAKAGDEGLTYDQLKPMLQQLIEQRFQLGTHREMRDAQGYALVVFKDAPKLVATKGGLPKPMIWKEGLRAQNISLDTLAAMLSNPTGRKVINKTGIDGNFDIKLEYAADNALESTLPSVFVAVQEQLGLKLVTQKVQVETFVIDHAERVPVEN